MTLFLTQKHLTRFLNTKYENKNSKKKSVGYLLDHIQGHGQGPSFPNSYTQPPPLSQGYNLGHLAEVHLPRSAAGLQYGSYSKSLQGTCTQVHSHLLYPQDI
jgi:hypothetical protein